MIVIIFGIFFKVFRDRIFATTFGWYQTLFPPSHPLWDTWIYPALQCSLMIFLLAICQWDVLSCWKCQCYSHYQWGDKSSSWDPVRFDDKCDLIHLHHQSLWSQLCTTEYELDLFMCSSQDKSLQNDPFFYNGNKWPDLGLLLEQKQPLFPQPYSYFFMYCLVCLGKSVKYIHCFVNWFEIIICSHHHVAVCSNQQKSRQSSLQHIFSGLFYLLSMASPL